MSAVAAVWILHTNCQVCYPNRTNFTMKPETSSRHPPVIPVEDQCLVRCFGIQLPPHKMFGCKGKKHTLPTTKIAFGNRPGPIHFQTTDCQVGYFSASGISPRVHMLPVLLRCNFPIFFAVEKIRETMWNMKGKVYISHMRSPPEECNIYIIYIYIP